MPYICYNLFQNQNSETFCMVNHMNPIIPQNLAEFNLANVSINVSCCNCHKARASKRQSKIRKAGWGRGEFSWRSCVCFGWVWRIITLGSIWAIMRPSFLEIMICHCGFWTLLGCRCTWACGRRESDFFSPRTSDSSSHTNTRPFGHWTSILPKTQEWDRQDTPFFFRQPVKYCVNLSLETSMSSRHGSTCSIERQTAPFGKPKVAKHSKPPGEGWFSDARNHMFKELRTILLMEEILR